MTVAAASPAPVATATPTAVAKPPAPITQTATQQPDPLQVRDVAAQEVMADAAIWMTLIAIVTVLVTTAGTVAIILQIKASRAANAIARSAIAAQNRAWLAVDPVLTGELHWDTDNPDVLRADFEVVVHNTGHSPATNVELDIHLVFDWLELSTIQARLASEFKADDRRFRHPNDTIFPNNRGDYVISMGICTAQGEYEKIKAKFKDMDRVPIGVGVVGCIQYQLPGSDALHQTGFAYSINKAHHTARFLALFDKDIPISANNLTLVMPLGGPGTID